MHTPSSRIRMVCKVACSLACVVGGAHLDRRIAAADPDEEFRPRVVIRRAFPAIVDAPVITAKQASSLQDNELVLGIVLGDTARAYPINMLTGPRREIINDTLNGRAIAATW